MYTFVQLPIPTQNRIRGLFDPNNYCFATTTDDRSPEDARSPTFYFAAGGIGALNTSRSCGRIRTCHKNGPLVDITESQKRHIFFADTSKRDDALKALKEGIEGNLLDNLLAENRSAPLDGDVHIEITMKPAKGKPYSRLHPSGGKVCTAPRITTWTQVENLLNLIFRERAPIELNRRALPVPVGLLAAPPHQPIADLTQFIAQL